MTDRTGLFGDWRVVLAGAVSVLTAAVVTVVVHTGNPAKADSYLSGVREAEVYLKDGSHHPAMDGERVPNGASVHTGNGGAAKLTTDGRDVYLGGHTTVGVVDGVHQSLQVGEVMTDTRNGPQVAMDTRAGTVTVADGALARIEVGNPELRVGVFSGSARLQVTGRQTTVAVPALYQLQAPVIGLPSAPTALVLTDDAWEQQLAGDLVNADRDLTALARGLSGPDGLVVLSAEPASLRSVPAVSQDRGEQALSVAIAQAARQVSSAHEALVKVQTARQQGGSWGVVAALVNARVSSVSGLLDSLLAPPGTSPSQVLAGPPPVLPNLVIPSTTPTPSSTRTTNGKPPPTTRPTHSRRPSPPSPSPSTVVDQVVTTVTGLLGTPSPTPSRSPGLSLLP